MDNEVILKCHDGTSLTLGDIYHAVMRTVDELLVYSGSGTVTYIHRYVDKATTGIIYFSTEILAHRYIENNTKLFNVMDMLAFKVHESNAAKNASGRKLRKEAKKRMNT